MKSVGDRIEAFSVTGVQPRADFELTDSLGIPNAMLV